MNPLTKPRIRQPRPKVTFDGTILNGNFISPLRTAASNQAEFTSKLDTNGADSITTQWTGIINNYAQYRFLKCTARWLPAVGPGVAAAGGRGYVAYLMNPEHMTTWEASSLATKVSSITVMRNMRTFNVWEPFQYSVPMTMRRKMFDCNFGETSDANVYDRSTQGMFVSAFETIGATDVIGKWIMEFTIECIGLEALGT